MQKKLPCKQEWDNEINKQLTHAMFSTNSLHNDHAAQPRGLLIATYIILLDTV